MLLALLVAVFLEKHTAKTSTNSSQPSSQTPQDESAIGRPGQHSKGNRLDQARSSNSRTVETVQVTELTFCEHCGEDLRKVACREHERRTQIDIVFEKVLTHVDAQIKRCPHCRTQTRAPFPEQFSGPLHYGPGIKAYVLNLLIAQMLSLKRVQQSIQTLIGLALSEATILRCSCIRRSSAGNTRPSNSCSPCPPCTWMKLRCASSGKTTGSTSAPRAILP